MINDYLYMINYKFIGEVKLQDNNNVKDLNTVKYNFKLNIQELTVALSRIFCRLISFPDIPDNFPLLLPVQCQYITAYYNSPLS